MEKIVIFVTAISLSICQLVIAEDSSVEEPKDRVWIMNQDMNKDTRIRNIEAVLSQLPKNFGYELNTLRTQLNTFREEMYTYEKQLKHIQDKFENNSQQTCCQTNMTIVEQFQQLSDQLINQQIHQIETKKNTDNQLKRIIASLNKNDEPNHNYNDLKLELRNVQRKLTKMEENTASHVEDLVESAIKESHQSNSNQHQLDELKGQVRNINKQMVYYKKNTDQKVKDLIELIKKSVID